MQRLAGDVARAWDITAISILVSLVVAVLYLVLFRFPGTLRFALIASCFLTLLLLLSIATFLYFEKTRVYDLLYDDDFYDVKMDGSKKDFHIKINSYLSFACIGIGVLITACSIFMIPKIEKSS
jgi:hypothetical protein